MESTSGGSAACDLKTLLLVSRVSVTEESAEDNGETERSKNLSAQSLQIMGACFLTFFI